jgi:hypothetical protein
LKRSREIELVLKKLKIDFPKYQLRLSYKKEDKSLRCLVIDNIDVLIEEKEPLAFYLSGYKNSGSLIDLQLYCYLGYYFKIKDLIIKGII